MSPSPKRKAVGDDSLNGNSEPKRPRIEHETPAAAPAMATAAPPPGQPAPDSQIDHAAAIAYWSATEPTVNGVLGGYPQVSRVDLQGSSNFLARLRRQQPQPSKRSSSTAPPAPTTKLSRAVDCGAGIGRITDGLLLRVAAEVDVVEPVRAFTDKLAGRTGVGRIFNVGLEGWDPVREGCGPYDLVWNQWCVGQLTDRQLRDYLRRLPAVLSPGGWIVVKENVTKRQVEEDVFDETDSSVTRSDAKFRAIFEEAGLRIVSTELQKGMPADLYPVRAYALQPRS